MSSLYQTDLVNLNLHQQLHAKIKFNVLFFQKKIINEKIIINRVQKYKITKSKKKIQKKKTNKKNAVINCLIAHLQYT